MRRLIGCVVALAVVTTFSLTSTAYASAFYDDFASGLFLPTGSGSLSASNVGATTETGEPAHANGPTGPFASIWFSWTAPGSGAVTFNTCGSDFDTTIAAYTGSAVNALTSQASNDDGGPDGCGKQSKITFSVRPATYHIAIDGFNGATGNAALNWAYTAAPANDDFANAETTSGASGAIKSSNADATLEPGEPSHSEYEPADHSVWYSWLAPSSGHFEFAVESTTFYPIAEVYTGTAVDQLTQLASTDVENGLARFAATQATEYFISVSGVSGSGDFKLTWQPSPYLPDAKIKRSTDASFTGNDEYGFGSQEVFAQVKPGKTATFNLEFENDGTHTDNFRIGSVCDGGNGFRYAFFDGATDVTDEVLNFAFTTPVLSTGQHSSLLLKIKASKKHKDTSFCEVDTDSNGEPVSDAVAANLRVKG